MDGVADGVADGVVETVFGVLLTTDHYEARRGHLDFRDGRLVAMRLGRHEPRSEGGLTVGVTIFPVPPAPDAGLSRARAVVRVYSGGRLDAETDLGEVSVHTDAHSA
jgi:hypothetical protein